MGHYFKPVKENLKQFTRKNVTRAFLHTVKNFTDFLLIKWKIHRYSQLCIRHNRWNGTFSSNIYSVVSVHRFLFFPIYLLLPVPNTLNLPTDQIKFKTKKNYNHSLGNIFMTCQVRKFFTFVWAVLSPDNKATHRVGGMRRGSCPTFCYFSLNYSY